MNLEPSTRYRVCVQLTRPGEGGEGGTGPEAIMETDCPGKTPQINYHILKDHMKTRHNYIGLETNLQKSLKQVQSS